MDDRLTAWRRSLVCWAGVMWLAGYMAALPGAAQDPPPPSPQELEAITPDEMEPDPDYQQVLAAYRGQLTPQELETLAEIDPTPTLYLSPNTPSERAVTLLFASLPDSAHQELREKGYLKWRITSLPAKQREWAKQGASRLETLGEGPFPIDGPNASVIGFARIKAPGQADPHYCWWISSSYARPAWITLVRAFGVITEPVAKAYQQQLDEILSSPETARIRQSDWVKISEPKPNKQNADGTPLPTLIDEEFYRQLVAAYAVKLRGEELRQLVLRDPLIEKRLLSAKPMDRAARRLLTTLSKAQHQHLLTIGSLVLLPNELSREQRKLLRPAIDEINAQAASSGAPTLAHSLEANGVSVTGFALVRVPGQETPSLCWWLRSFFSPDVLWVTLSNHEAVSDPGYYDAHLAQIPRP